MEQVYTSYYSNQIGSGLSHIGSLYVSPRVVQHGRGLGSFFASFFRNLKPLFLSGLNAIKDQAMDTGKSILNDFGRKPLRNILAEQGKKALSNLTEKAVNKISSKFQKGSGKSSIRRRIKRKRRQSQKRSTSKRTKKFNLRNKVKDIFA